MAIVIDNPTIERDILELAKQRGQTVDDIVGSAVRQMRGGRPRIAAPKASAEEIKALIRSFPRVPLNYSFTEDEILGYGPSGYCE